MSGRISGVTHLACIIGHPVRHSLSPAIHNAAFAAAGIDWVYTAFEVEPASLPAAVIGLRALAIAGANVTMPHKQEIIPLLDDVSFDAFRIGAVNTLVNKEGMLIGRNTDGEGFLRSLREHGVEPRGRAVLILGAGGAARAIADALASNAAAVVIAARKRGDSESVAALAGDSGVACSWDDRDEVARDAQIIVNATSLGARGEPAPIDVSRLSRGTTVVDLVYGQLTPLVAAARKAGLDALDGLGMLIHQAALAFEAWTGIEAPLQAMRDAVRDSTNEPF